MKITKFLLLGALMVSLASCNPQGNDIVIKDYDDDKPINGDQFDFDGNYTPPELTIDGVKNEEQWNNASQIITYGSTNQAKVQIYRGDDALFCFFEVSDPDIETVGNNNGDDVTKGDSVEIYFDFKNDGSNRPEPDDIQINIGAHGKTRIFVGANGEWGSWNGLLDYEIRLNGTLNYNKDVDVGYNIELMIPYSQVGIDKYSTFGVAFGHVARGTDSTNPDLQYTWGGLTYEGSFVDPQVPRTYVVLLGDNFYSRQNMPVGNIEISGKVLDENGSPVANVKVDVNGTTYKTLANGQYSAPNVLADNGVTITISREGYKTYSRTYRVNELKSENSRITANFVIISENSTATVKLKGVVKNPSEGNVANATIKVGDTAAVSSSDGSFSITAKIDYDLSVDISKELYKTSSTQFDIYEVVGKSEIDIGVVSLYSPSSFATFGGSRGIQSVTVEIYRGFEGINFLFTSKSSITNGDHVEMFVDSKTTFHGRDTTDYRIDFNSEGNISIVNFGNGTNTVVSTSGIKNNAYLKGETYYMETLLPYSFLGVSETDIIGVSFGVWSQRLSDWDGWNYAGEGFADYVAPEYTDQYCRIGLDNGLYRAGSNSVLVTKIYGTVTDTNNNPITTAVVNGHIVDENGKYYIYIENNTEITLTVHAPGYVEQQATVTAAEVQGTPVNKNFTLAKAEAIITGTINVDDVKIYLEGNPSIVVYSSNGTYSITVPTTGNAYIIFEKTGYKKVRKGFSVVALTSSANSNQPITYNCTMELE